MLEQKTGVYDNPYKFNAKELDRETGLYYYGARYYNPRASIWYGVDPLAVHNPVMETEFYGEGEHNDGVYFWGNLNPYIYTYQNPIKYVDPNGKQTFSLPLLGGARIIVLGTGGFVSGVAGGVFGGLVAAGYGALQQQKIFQQQRGYEFSRLSHQEEKEKLLQESFPVAEQDNLTIKDFPAAIKQKITILNTDHSKNDKKKVNSAEVGDIVQTLDSHPQNFNKKGKNYTNNKTNEIWQKSTTEHSGEKEWKVGIGRNEPTKSKKITVTSSDSKILKKNL
ncbi:RHS repeat-associated core domain-containing protein [Chryseobacterium panacisoli]|uniref:RHS repeat-associated core domain-containing protein n=1 Tax=Chryseobacterium panacisoli TaxID=1807141 RepID=A0A5D8ZBN8_9FLAO|nr:RHS repeat-associated core domain-containing protein [Chryseobacterium panacisoli]TZF92345.1 RHS repeat-associated core domain-containing protein [Chryseobacterium panacisoli]